MRDNGFIVVRNPIFKSSLWPKYGGYWLDLVRFAAFRDATMRFCGARVELKRGQCMVSVRFLEKRWGMSKSSVHRFLKRLEREGYIKRRIRPVSGTRDGTRCGTEITIVNYRQYQLLRVPRSARMDSDWDSSRYKEEVSSKNEMKEVPPFASEREPQTNPAETDGVGSDLPSEVDDLLTDLSAVLADDIVATVFSANRALELVDWVGWPEVRSRAFRISEQLAGTVEGPVSLAALLEEVAEELGPEGGIAPSRRSCDETPESPRRTSRNCLHRRGG